MESMWTVHSYNGDYNPVHDHATRTPMGVSLIYYLKVPRCIERLGNPAEEFGGLNESSGNVDGFHIFNLGVKWYERYKYVKTNHRGIYKRQKLVH